MRFLTHLYGHKTNTESHKDTLCWKCNRSNTTTSKARKATKNDILNTPSYQRNETAVKMICEGKNNNNNKERKDINIKQKKKPQFINKFLKCQSLFEDWYDIISFSLLVVLPSFFNTTLVLDRPNYAGWIQRWLTSVAEPGQRICSNQ